VGTLRPLNRCSACRYTFYPRGKDVSLRCPRCAGGDVKRAPLLTQLIRSPVRLVFMVGFVVLIGIGANMLASRGEVNPHEPGADSLVPQEGTDPLGPLTEEVEGLLAEGVEAKILNFRQLEEGLQVEGEVHNRTSTQVVELRVRVYRRDAPERGWAASAPPDLQPGEKRPFQARVPISIKPSELLAEARWKPRRP
jgi:hypothetical protein